CDEQVGLRRTQDFDRSLTRGNGDGAGADRAGATDVVRRIANHDDFAVGSSIEVLEAGGQGGSGDIVAVGVFVAKTAEGEPIPQAVVSELVAGRLVDVAGEQAQ